MKELVNHEKYPLGMPTIIGGIIRPLELRRTKNKWNAKDGHHFVRVNHNTWIEVKDDADEELAVFNFIQKLQRRDQAYYSNIDIKSSQHLER